MKKNYRLHLLVYLTAIFACVLFLVSCQQEQTPTPAQHPHPQSNIVEIIIVGHSDSAYVNGNLVGGFYYVTDSTYNEYDFNVDPASQAYSVTAQYTSSPSDSISIYVLINSSQVASAHGLGFASCLFVY